MPINQQGQRLGILHYFVNIVTCKNSRILNFFWNLGLGLALTAFQIQGDSIQKASHKKDHHLKTEHLNWKGTASVYSRKFQGRRTASGEIFDVNKISAAHKFLPLGTRVKVIHLKNLCSIELIINDRLSSSSPHIIDLSPEAARQIEIPTQGIGKVRIERLAPTK